jgi:hypothetical protein
VWWTAIFVMFSMFVAMPGSVGQKARRGLCNGDCWMRLGDKER